MLHSGYTLEMEPTGLVIDVGEEKAGTEDGVPGLGSWLVM